MVDMSFVNEHETNDLLRVSMSTEVAGEAV